MHTLWRLHKSSKCHPHSPLYERRKDIPLLCHRFIENISEELKISPKLLMPKTLKILEKLDQSGNVRQLENVCRYCMIMAASNEILPDDLPSDLHKHSTKQSSNEHWTHYLQTWIDEQLQQGNTNILKTATPEFEAVMIQSALSQTQERRQEAEKLLD